MRFDDGSVTERGGMFRQGHIELDGPVGWPEGTRVVVMPVQGDPRAGEKNFGNVLIAGFGLAGRCVADLLDQSGIRYVIVERNPATVETQAALGRRIFEGDISDEATLTAAVVQDAAVLALTIPDEAAVLRAIEQARRLNPKLYIIARTTYASRGMQAAQLGADDVVKSEQAVALQFYEKLRRKLGCRERVARQREG